MRSQAEPGNEIKSFAFLHPSSFIPSSFRLSNEHPHPGNHLRRNGGGGCDRSAGGVSSVVASQDELHGDSAEWCRKSLPAAHVERILPVIDETLRKAGMTLEKIDAVAVANTPGLAGSLLVGLVAAKAICLARRIPLLAVNHLQAHIYACRMAAGEEVFPCVGLIISGGHTSLYRCRDPLEFELLGSTIDDAAGEAFDKVAAMLGLPYPGGPSIQRAAEGGNPQGIQFSPRVAGRRQPAGFQLQRFENGGPLRYCRTGKARFLGDQSFQRQVADLAASFQEAVVDCLVGKALAALRKTGHERLMRGRRRGGQRPAATTLDRGSRNVKTSACTSLLCACAPTTP